MTDKSSELSALIASNAEIFYEDAPCGYIFTDPDGHFIRANRTFLAWTGYPHQDLCRMRFQDILTVGSRIYYETNYHPLLRMQGFLNEITLDVVTRDKSYMPVLISSSELRGDDSKPLLIRSTIFNITDRRKYEKELLTARKEAEAAALRMHLLARTSELLRSSTDFRNNFQDISDLIVEDFSDVCIIELIQKEKVLRLEASHLDGVKARGIRIYPRPDRSTLITDVELDKPSGEFDEVVETLEPQSLIVCPFGRKGSEKGWISFYQTQLGRRFNNKDLELVEQMAHMLCAAIETSEMESLKEKAEAELRESHEWYSTTLKSIGDAVIAIRPDKTMEYLNPVAEELTGWSQTEAFGRPMEEVFNIINAKTGGPAFNPVDRVLAERIVVGLVNNTALIKKNGAQIIIEDSASPILDKRGNIRGVVLVFRDTTLKHQEEVERIKILSSLKEEKDVREKFVATLTHDLRSPLTAAKLSIQLLEKTLHDPDKARNFAFKTLNSLNRVDRMIQDLLDANQMRAGEKIKMKMTSFDMRELVDEVVHELILVYRDRFVIEAPSVVSGYWDKEGMRRILENLCNNAVKYGHQKTPITITLKTISDELQISVHNQGNSIPEKDLEHLFDPYHRAETAGTQKGWGLGLTLVKGVTEGHNGSVTVRSSESEGTTFEVTLPLDSRISNPD